MEILNIQQGTKEWHQHRLNHFNASDAPAMMGRSSYKSRAELVKQFATGIVEEVDSRTQKRFDDGHRFEALARPLAEALVGEQLSACVCKDGKLSASLDGLTFDCLTAWEHKTLNNKLRSVFERIYSMPAKEREFSGGMELPDEYKIQMEHQALVTGCKRVLFMASSWDDDNLIKEQHCWYYPQEALRKQIQDGWNQFEVDVEAYKSNPTPKATKVVAESVESLPVPVVRVDGSLTVNCNLSVFSQALKDFIKNIPNEPITDQDFANAESACKVLKKAEASLDQAEESALAHIPDIEKLRRTIADLKDLARKTRLKTEKMVSAEKETRKMQLVLQAQQALEAHADVLNAELKQANAGQIQRVQNGVFAQAIKGLKRLDSMSEKIATALVSEKSALDYVARTMRMNRDLLKTEERDWMFLFADFERVGSMDPKDFESLIRDRVSQFKKEQKAKQEVESKVESKVEQEVEIKPSTVEVDDEVPGTTLMINDVNRRLGFDVNVKLLDLLGIHATSNDVYEEHQFNLICDALIKHIKQVQTSFNE